MMVSQLPDALPVSLKEETFKYQLRSNRHRSSLPLSSCPQHTSCEASSGHACMPVRAGCADQTLRLPEQSELSLVLTGNQICGLQKASVA